MGLTVRKILREERGMTMVEMIVAMVVIAIVLAVAIPNLPRTVRLHRLRSASSTMHSALLRARSMAVTRGAPVRVSLNADTETVVVQEDVDNDGDFDTMIQRELPSGIQISNIALGGANSITFSGQGVPSVGGTIQLQTVSGESKTVRIAAGSGSVSIDSP